MSASDKEVSNVGSYRHDGDGDDDSADGDNEDGKKHHSCYGIGKDMGKAKQVVMHHFIKAKKKLHNSRNKRAPRSSLSGNTSRTSDETIRGGCDTGCYFCFMRPQVAESFNGCPTSDPNDPNFSNFIEKNDFYSKECNPHVD